jgi:uncharacterized protein
MKRLAPLLVHTDGVVHFRAEFRLDEDKRATVQLDTQADVSLLCQRSLLPYVERIERSSLLGIIEDEAEQVLLPQHYEASLTENRRLSFLTLVEDEMLLGLPQVPRNPEVAPVEYKSGSPVASPESATQEQSSGPFAALAQLLPDSEKD